MNNYNLFKHSFWMEVGQDCIPIMQKLDQETNDFNKMFDARNEIKEWQYSDREYYFYIVFRKLIAILDVYELLKQAQTHMSGFPSPRKYEQKGITQFNWLAYHYALHVLMYCSLLDVSLILINAVYILGLPDEQCKYKRIRNGIKSESIRNSLEKMRTLTSPYQKIRNRFVHHGKIPNIINITNSPRLYLLQMFQAQGEPMSKLRLTYREAIDATFRLESDSIVKKLDGDTILIEQAIYSLFTHLQKVYHIQKSQL